MAGRVWKASTPDAVIDPLIYGKASFHSVEEESWGCLGAFWLLLGCLDAAVIAAVWSESLGQATSASGTRNTCRPGTATSMIPSLSSHDPRGAFVVIYCQGEQLKTRGNATPAPAGIGESLTKLHKVCNGMIRSSVMSSSKGSQKGHSHAQITSRTALCKGGLVLRGSPLSFGFLGDSVMDRTVPCYTRLHIQCEMRVKLGIRD